MVWLIYSTKIYLTVFLMFFAQLRTKYVDILYAIRVMESSNGLNCKPRYEKSFLKRYGDQGIMPELREKYGDRTAASSFGCYQILLCKANEVLKTTDLAPEDLENPWVNEVIAITIVDQYYTKCKGNLRQVFLKWNGSSAYDDRALRLMEKERF